jgi:hypothetical protein
VFTARYALSPYIKQIHFVFKGLNYTARWQCVNMWSGTQTVITVRQYMQLSPNFNRLVLCQHQWIITNGIVICHRLLISTSRISYIRSLLRQKNKNNHPSSRFQASVVMLMTAALFWHIMQRQMVILYWCLGTMYQSYLQGPRPLKMGPVGCPEMLVQNYNSTLHIAEKHRSHLLWQKP